MHYNDYEHTKTSRYGTFVSPLDDTCLPNPGLVGSVYLDFSPHYQHHLGDTRKQPTLLLNLISNSLIY